MANRYVDLQLPPADHQQTIPAGGVIDQTDTTTAVDLDQLFDTFDPKTRKALSGVIRGFGSSYAGKGEQANAGWAYLNPSLAASSRLFKALDSDTPALKRFVTASSQLVGDLAARRADLAGLVDHLATTTGAIGRQKQALSTAIGDLPGFMRRADTTFVNLRATLDDLAAAGRRVQARGQEAAARSWPSCARWRATRARRCATSRAWCARPGASNDLIELTKSSVPLRNAAVGPTKRNGKERDGAFPASTQALKDAAPELATARPYAPDLTGWFDDFSHSGLYDALGGASRAGLYVNLFAPVNGVLKPLLEPAAAERRRSRTRRRWTSAGAARARSSAARRTSRPPTSPATRPRGRWGREARARSPSSPWPASASPGSP